MQIYEDDRDLVSSVTEFLTAGIAGGDRVIVVATPAHRHALLEAARTADVDLSEAGAAGRFVALDAQELLTAFMVDGTPDPVRFDDVIGGLVREATPGGVRIFGEMVAVLWDEGNVTGAIALERLWNDLGAVVPFELYCSYAMSSFTTSSELGAIREVCDHHADVVGPAASDERSVRALHGVADLSELFMPVPLAIRSSRRLVERTLRAWGEDALIDDALIVTSELATNAVVHAASPFRVSLTLSAATVELTVHDAGRGTPEPRDAPAQSVTGRGLALVEALSTRWGTECIPDGKVVWAQFDRSSS